MAAGPTRTTDHADGNRVMTLSGECSHSGSAANARGRTVRSKHALRVRGVAHVPCGPDSQQKHDRQAQWDASAHHGTEVTSTRIGARSPAEFRMRRVHGDD